MTLHKFFAGVSVTCLVLLGILVFTPSILMIAFSVITAFVELDHAASLRLMWAVKFLFYSGVQNFGVVISCIGGLFCVFIASSVLARLTDKQPQAIPTPPKP